jgi:hypothetical protein
MDVWLSIKGDEPVTGLEELSDWLRREPWLRGLVSVTSADPRPGELGAVAEALVVAVGSGGVISVLASSLKVFLALPRRSDVRIVISSPDGLRVEIDAKRIADADALIREALGGME